MSSDLLMTWFEHAGYGGASADIYGSEGPCDTAGYEFHPDTTWWWSWGNIISSAAGTDQCNIARFITQSGTYGVTYLLPVAGFNPTVNDNVGIIRAWHN